MNIEIAAEFHAAAIASIQNDAARLAYAKIFPATSSAPTLADLERQWLTMITEPETVVLTVTEDEQVMGAVAVGANGDVPSGLLLSRLYVQPEGWGRGFGSVLHDEALAVARRRSSDINLWVLEANTKARGMYERRGWSLVPGRTLANDPPEIKDVLYQFEF